MVTVLVIVAWWFYCEKQAQIAVGLASLFLPRLPLAPPLFVPLRCLVANPLYFPPPLNPPGRILSPHATFSERGLRLSGTGATWSRTVLLYLLIIF